MQKCTRNIINSICTRTGTTRKFSKIKRRVNKLLKIGDIKEKEVIDIDDEENEEIEEYSKNKKQRICKIKSKEDIGI